MQHPTELILPLAMIAVTVWNAFHQLRWHTVARRFPAPPITSAAGEFSEFTYIVVRVSLDGRRRGFPDCFVSIGADGLRIAPRAGRLEAAFIPWTTIEDVREIRYVRRSPRRHIGFRLTEGSGAFTMEEPAGTAGWIGWRMARGKQGRSLAHPHES
jgi:hypothetical protein